MFSVLADARNELSLHTSYKRFWWPEYKPDSVYAAVSRMVKVREIERTVDKTGEAVLRLKAKGGKLLDSVLPLGRLQQQGWDGKWRFAIFDIPEKQRRLRVTVREKLKSLGFGMWQKSVYATPHDVVGEMNEYLEEQGLFPMVVCFESRRIGVGDNREFADLVFGTEQLNDSYFELVEKAGELESQLNHEHISSYSFEQKFRTLWNAYFDLIEQDPFLPFELLPKPWYAHEAKRALRSLAKKSALNLDLTGSDRP